MQQLVNDDEVFIATVVGTCPLKGRFVSQLIVLADSCAARC